MLLFARSIDTNRDCSRIVFDSWLQFKFVDTPAAQVLLFQAVELREALNSCLEQKLEGGSYRSDKLAGKLIEFMQTELMSNFKSLMKADQKCLYTGPLNAELELPDTIRIRFERTMRYDDVKGGIALTDVRIQLRALNFVNPCVPEPELCARSCMGSQKFSILPN
jgi:hypothetical protein